MRLASEALFHGAFDLAFCRLFGDLAAFVVLLFAAGDGDLELYVAVLGVQPQGDERLAFLLGLAGKTVDLLAVQQELAVAGRELLAVGGVLVRGDVGADEEVLPVPYSRVALLEVSPSGSDGLNLGTGQLDTGFVGLLDGEVVQRLFVLREDSTIHNRFTTLNSARCISG